ncbi:MAG: hypothetical protein GX201_10695 [Clostridiales bacterium]|nr:hypothetical protein [Clostridiales bacterium]
MRIKINISFILFLFISIYLGFWENSLVIFFSVLVHELAHIFVAKYFGLQVLEIRLYPFGGIAYTENIAKYGGSEEAVVALAGPIISMLIAAFFYFFANEFYLSNTIIRYNKTLFIFNLIPALPLDGGSIVRSLLLSKFSYKKATKYMTRVGKSLAILIIGYNIYMLLKGNATITYSIAGGFIFLGALREEKNCSYIYLLNRNNKKVRKYRDLPKRLIKVSKETYLKSIADQFSPGNICKILVYDEKGILINELNEADIMDGFLKYGYYGKIKNIVE